MVDGIYGFPKIKMFHQMRKKKFSFFLVGNEVFDLKVSFSYHVWIEIYKFLKSGLWTYGTPLITMSELPLNRDRTDFDDS